MCRILTFFLYSFVFKLKTHVMYTEWHFPKPPIWVYDVSTILLFTSRHLMDHLVNSRSPLVSRSFPGTYLGCADLSFQTNEKKKIAPPRNDFEHLTNKSTDNSTSYYAMSQIRQCLAEKISSLATTPMRKCRQCSLKNQVLSLISECAKL